MKGGKRKRMRVLHCAAGHESTAWAAGGTFVECPQCSVTIWVPEGLQDRSIAFWTVLSGALIASFILLVRA
ncbi:hypothetical protein GCM10009730_61420 [Streptomyces albidochromogenes]